jgi:hypothetical protein
MESRPGLPLLIPLDPLDELFVGYQGRYGSGHNGVVVLGIKGRLEHQLLRAAVRNIQHRHPKLRCRIIESSDGHHCFELLPVPPAIPIEVREFDTDELPWKEESSLLMRAKMDPSVDPLVRVSLLIGRRTDQCFLILLGHHALGDAGSLLRLAEDLLVFYEETRKSGKTSSVESFPIARVRGMKRSDFRMFKRLLMGMRVLQHGLENRKGSWLELPSAEGIPIHHRWSHFLLSDNDTLALVRRCRKEKTTIYGALLATAGCALIATLPQATARVKCRIPINIRDNLLGVSGPITNHDLGNYVVAYEAFYSVDKQTSLWTLARTVRREVEYFAAAGGPSLIYNLLRFAKPARRVDAPKRGTMLVNSYGIGGFRDRYDAFSVEELAIFFNNDHIGPSLIIQAIVVQRRLNLSISLANVPEEFWINFRAAMRKKVQEIVAG